MASLRDIKTRIESVRSIQQITRAMKMVAVARLRKAQQRLIDARPYSNNMQEVLSSIVQRVNFKSHPLLAHRDSDRIGLVIVTADRGLCGSFNSNIIRRAKQFLDETDDPSKVSLMCVGKKNYTYFKRKDNEILESYMDFYNELSFRHAVNISRKIIKFYNENKFGKLVLIYNEFKSVIQQNIIVKELLPFSKEEFTEKESTIDYIYEPNAYSVLDSLLPKYLDVQIYRTLLESNAAEQGARMTAMGAATDNAIEMVAKYTLQYNRTRQAVITKELSEIVGGAEALN